MKEKIQLRLMGLSFNPLQDGAFALLLSAKESRKRIPVIIGAAEAQSIAVIIENIEPQRPMTHDLFATLAHAYGIELKEVFIYKFEDGIFFSEMTFSDGIRDITLDSRTSDAVAVAIRTGAPIFTTPAILEETGVEFMDADSAENDDEYTEEEDFENNVNDENIVSGETDFIDNDNDMEFEAMSDQRLNEELEKAIDNDNFEDAAIIRKILDQRAESDTGSENIS